MRFAAFILLVVASITFAACETTGDQNKAKPQQTSQAITNTYEERLNAAVPYPLDQISDSVERRNLREKLLRFNTPSKIGYVYLMTDFGQVVAYFTIKGKVSSTQSMLTVTQQGRCLPVPNRDDPCFIVDSVGDDGSYGANEDGVFFFTTENVLITWNGSYLYSDYPLDIATEPVAVYDAENAKPSSVGE